MKSNLACIYKILVLLPYFIVVYEILSSFAEEKTAKNNASTTLKIYTNLSSLENENCNTRYLQAPS